ncbi:Hypothetical predicted protein, partial [Paramuricea clavata]
IRLIIGDNTFSRIRTETVCKGEQGDPIVEETSFGEKTVGYKRTANEIKGRRGQLNYRNMGVKFYVLLNFYFTFLCDMNEIENTIKSEIHRKNILMTPLVPNPARHESISQILVMQKRHITAACSAFVMDNEK